MRLKVRDAARKRIPLDGADSQALEGALQQVERELAEALEALRELVDIDPVCFPEKAERIIAITKAKAILAKRKGE